MWDVPLWLHSITWEQFQTWMDYYQVEPFGEERADLRIATLTALTANINRDPDEHPDAYSPIDFAPFLLPIEQTQETEEDAYARTLAQWEDINLQAKAHQYAENLLRAAALKREQKEA